MPDTATRRRQKVRTAVAKAECARIGALATTALSHDRHHHTTKENQ
ncbi:hypothetical protein [Streptomyces sp. NPDC057199]